MSLVTIDNLIARYVRAQRGVTEVQIPGVNGSSSASLVVGQGGPNVPNPSGARGAVSAGQLELNNILADILVCLAEAANQVVIKSLSGLRAALRDPLPATLIINTPLTIEGDEFLNLCIEGKKTVIQSAAITVNVPATSAATGVFEAKAGSILDWYQGAEFNITDGGAGGVKPNIPLFLVHNATGDAKPVVNWINYGNTGIAILLAGPDASSNPTAYLAMGTTTDTDTLLVSFIGTSPDGGQRKAIAGFKGGAVNSASTLINLDKLDHVSIEAWKLAAYTIESSNVAVYEKSSADFGGERLTLQFTDAKIVNVSTNGNGVQWLDADKAATDFAVTFIRSAYRVNIDWNDNVSSLTDADTIQRFSWGLTSMAGSFTGEMVSAGFTNAEGTALTTFVFTDSWNGEVRNYSIDYAAAAPGVLAETANSAFYDSVISGNMVGSFGDSTSDFFRTEFVVRPLFTGVMARVMEGVVMVLQAGIGVVPDAFAAGFTASEKIIGLKFDWNGNTVAATITELTVTAPLIHNVTSSEGKHNTTLTAGLTAKVDINGVNICGAGAVTVSAPADGFARNIVAQGGAATDNVTFAGNSGDLMYCCVGVLPSGAGAFAANGATAI